MKSGLWVNVKKTENYEKDNLHNHHLYKYGLLSSCHIYRNYQRPDNLPTDSLFRDADNQPVTDSLSLGDLPWQEIFQDTLLQQYIGYGLEHNTDMQTALLRVD